MAPSQKSAENFNKKEVAKKKRGIVASGAAGNGRSDSDPIQPKVGPG
jgi:hypothetical protein